MTQAHECHERAHPCILARGSILPLHAINTSTHPLTHTQSHSLALLYHSSITSTSLPLPYSHPSFSHTPILPSPPSPSFRAVSSLAFLDDSTPSRSPLTIIQTRSLTDANSLPIRPYSFATMTSDFLKPTNTLAPAEAANVDTPTLPEALGLPPLPSFTPISLGLTPPRTESAPPATSLRISTEPPVEELKPATPSPSPPSTPITPVRAAVASLPLEQLTKTPGGLLATSLLASDVWGKAATAHAPRAPSPAPSSATPEFLLTIPFMPSPLNRSPQPVRERVISSPRPLRPVIRKTETQETIFLT